MKSGKRPLPVTIFLMIGFSTFLVWTFLSTRDGTASEHDREQSIKAEAHVSTQEDGQAVVTLDEAACIKAGIVVKPLEMIPHRKEFKAIGRVMDARGLIDLRDSYSAAGARVEKTEAALGASRNEYKRLKALYKDNRNIAEKALQSSEAVWRSDEADADAAKSALVDTEALMRQRWGDVITGWLIDNSLELKRLLQRKYVLIQVTVQQDTPFKSAPQTAMIDYGGRTLLAARFVSSSPLTDLRVQGMSFFYIMPARPCLPSGLNVIVYLPDGPMCQGVFVPGSAVVWLNGKAWIYLQEGVGRFVRRQVSTKTPVAGGYVVLKGLGAGGRAVVSGAQALLSEESLSQIRIED